MIYNFVKITNNNDTSDFIILHTTQKNWSNRYSGLRYKAILYYYENIGKFRDVYRFFTLDSSICRVDKKDFASKSDANEYNTQLEDIYRQKLKFNEK